MNQDYDNILTQELNKIGLSHEYIGFGEYDHLLESHIIYATEKKRFLGLIVYNSKIKVASVLSEPRITKTKHFVSRLRYDGLEIAVNHPDYLGKIDTVAKEIQSKLGENVIVICTVC